MKDKPLPLYGDGKNVRDWIYVEDNCEGIYFAGQHGKPGEIYNIGGGHELTNLQLTHTVLQEMGKGQESIQYVQDRPGHDRRYALDCAKVNQLGWNPRFNFEQAMAETIQWYKANSNWWKPLKK